MIQLKNTKNWEITQDYPRTGRPRTARTPKKIKAAQERIRRNPHKGDGRKPRYISIFYAFHSQKRPYKYLGNSVSGTDRNEIESLFLILSLLISYIFYFKLVRELFAHPVEL